MRITVWKHYATIFLLLFCVSKGVVASQGSPQSFSNKNQGNQLFRAPCSANFESGTYDYVDMPVVINGGTTVLNSGVYTIKADTQDVTVFLCSDASVVGNVGCNTHLRFIAETGHTITVKVDHNFSLEGGAQNAPLLVTFGGFGQVVFEEVGGHSVTFGSEYGPTKAFVLMESPCYTSGERPTLLFKRQCMASDADNSDIGINIEGPGSLVSFLSAYRDLSQVDDEGLIVFDVSNVVPSSEVVNPGSMKLSIGNKAAFVTAGHWVNAAPRSRGQVVQNCRGDDFLYNSYFTLNDIDLTIAAGYKAATQVKVDDENESYCYKTQGRLIVSNNNQTLSELLSDPFCHLNTRTDFCHYKGSFNGIRYGFILGANGLFDIADKTYVMYEGFADNVCPDTIPSLTEIPCFAGAKVKRLVKDRNPSAFIVDGNNNPLAQAAEIKLGKRSGLFFRSLAECSWSADQGLYIFDVEAPVNVYGNNKDDEERSKIEILSLYTTLFGGELFYGDHTKQFPARTFDRAESCFEGDYERVGDYLHYNKAAFLINDTLSLYNTSLVHTDQNHRVFEKNDKKSEPTYVGGEKWLIGCGQIICTQAQNACETDDVVERPKIAFYNSRFDVHTDVALTGVDLSVPNFVDEIGQCRNNISRFVFYQNGRRLSNGVGRNMILGTFIGSTACDGCSVLNKDAHVDVIQAQEGDYCSVDQLLSLETAANTKDIVEDIQSLKSIALEQAVHTIYLGYNSNISVGSHVVDLNTNTFETATAPTLLINGNFFAISSRGGVVGNPTTSHITGQGGIFVDENGLFTIGRNYRATLDTMVTRSVGGTINLPANQVVFGSLLGITDWKLDLSDDMQHVLVSEDEQISNYTFAWQCTKRDYNGESLYRGVYSPYALPSVNVCHMPEVTEANVSALATVQGTVDQFQIQGSRIGDEAHLLVDGGYIRELVFAPTNHGGEAPAAVVVLRNNGRVGIGPVDSSTDAVFAATTLGINGVTIIADGDGRVDLNEDLIIDNRCAFVKGPHFNSATDVLLISSDTPHVLRVQSGGVLDFQSFNEGDTVKFGGQIRLIMEPGSRIIMGGGVWQIANDVNVIMDPYVPAQDFFNAIPLGAQNDQLDPLATIASRKAHNPFASLTDHLDGLQNTDAFRIKILGTGTIQLTDDARLFIDKDAFVGVETFVDPQDATCVIDTTDITIELKDSSLFSLGGDRVSEGGSFQVGNTQNLSGHKVNFTLLLNGVDAQFNVGPQGFLGLSGGIVDRRFDDPNGWLVDVLWNVKSITIDLRDGLFKDSNIFSGDDSHASLLMLGQEKNSTSSAPVPAFTFVFSDGTDASTNLEAFRLGNANVKGGGNMVVVTRGTGAIHPIVLQDDDVVDVSNALRPNTIHPTMRVGMLASLPLLGTLNTLNNVDASTLFDALKTTEATQDSASRSVNLGDASITQDEFSGITTELRIGYINNGIILRTSVFDVTDSSGGTSADRVRQASDRGAVAVGIDVPTGQLVTVTQLS